MELLVVGNRTFRDKSPVMPAQLQPLAKLNEYAGKVREAEYGLGVRDVDEDYAHRLTKSLESLQHQVKQHEAALEKLRKPSSVTLDVPSHDPRQRLQQLRVITAAYKSLTPAEPILPSSNSPLQALLALRRTLTLVDQTKASVLETHENIRKFQDQVRQDEADLRDARSMTMALETRIERLRLKDIESLDRSSEELAKAMMQEYQQQSKNFKTQLRGLVRSFNKFVDEHLAIMLAAEELGGPVVGDLIGLDEGMLKAGFNHQGKTKKAKSDNASTNAKRKRRNDEVWGSKNEHEEAEDGIRSEKQAAHANFRSLTEDLLNAAAGDEDSGPYINIARESAAVRFLVRANVAQFHPSNARRLRLIDFGS